MLQYLLTALFILTFANFLPAQCPPGEIQDCNGNCYPAEWIGDGVCDDGIQFPSDFMCDQFNWDGGDCECPDDHFIDCSGNCWPDEMLQYLGNWHCNGGFWESSLVYFNHGPVELDFNCELFNFDSGDCITQGCTDPLAENYYVHAVADDGSCFYGSCQPGTMDCMGNCIPENWIGENECEGLSEDPLSHLFYGAYPNELLAGIPVGDSPRGMCVLPDGSKAYIGCGSVITVVDLEVDGSCGQTINIPTGGLVYTTSASPDGTKVFGASYSTNQVKVFNTTTNAVIANIPVGVNPLKMWTGNNGEYLFVSCSFSNEVYMISIATLSVVHVFNVGNQPRNICTSPDDSKLYSADWASFTMTAYSTSPPYELLGIVPVDYYPQAIWATPDDKYVLVANFGFDLSYDHCTVIRTQDWQVIARLQTGAGPEDMVSIGEEGQYLYVSNWGMPCCFYNAYDFCCSSEINQGSVSIIAVPDFDAIVPPGTIPDPIPYINSTLQILPLQAEYSFGMATHPSGEFIYVVNMESDLMSVIGFGNTPTSLQGENCSDPKVLTTLTDCVEDSTFCYFDNYNESCPFTETGGADLVYSYSPATSISGSFSMCTSDYDTKIYIYEDDCTPGTAIYCNDDYCGINGWRSYLGEVTLLSGHTYFIVVDGFGAADKGNFQLCFDMACTSDLTGDGIINISDLLLLIGGYGTQYNTSSLLIFLADFGNLCEP